MRHFIHYIKRVVVDAGENIDPDVLPYAEQQPEDQGFETPAYHSVPLNSGVASRVDVGDTIWLFSQLSSCWGKLPPSLDGMIGVAEINKDGRMPGRYWFGAASHSKWFCLFNASDLIGELKSIDVRGKVRRLIEPPQTAIGQAARFIREISDASSLNNHAAIVDETKPDFISYRITDGTKSAFELAMLLLENKRAVFWDRWSLPRRLAERNESVGPEALDARIDTIIRSSRAVWGVSSKLYGVDGSYSKLEKDLAERIGNFRPYPPWSEG